MNRIPDDDDRSAAAWWEKTVEYAFVRDVMPPAHEAYPLDGNAEKAYGDLITKDCVGYRLVEFKATRRDIWSEKKKYDSFLKADANVDRAFHSLLAHCEEAIVTHPGCAAHWLIYGVPKKDAPGFTLEARAYAGDGSEVTPLASPSHLEQLTTVGRDDLLKYLNILETARGSAGTSTSSGSALLIVGVRGARTVTLTEEEFRNPYPRPAAEQELEFDGRNEPPRKRYRPK